LYSQRAVFYNVVLADEISRVTAKVQSALLEAVSENQVTIGEQNLPRPLLVMATRNSIEQEGTYRLPEAGLIVLQSRLMLTIPARYEEIAVLEQVVDKIKIALQGSVELRHQILRNHRINQSRQEIRRCIVSLVAVSRIKDRCRFPQAFWIS